MERYEYTPYGERKVFSHGWTVADLDQDGDVDLSDLAMFSAEEDEVDAHSPCDVDGDGDIDLSDFTQFTGKYGTSNDADPLVLYPTETSYRRGYSFDISGAPMCEFGHQGLMQDEEFDLIYNRARMLHPTLGRFIQRDPMRYIDGMNIYEYIKTRSLTLVDPHGLWGITVRSGMVPCTAQEKTTGGLDCQRKGKQLYRVTCWDVITTADFLPVYYDVSINRVVLWECRKDKNDCKNCHLIAEIPIVNPNGPPVDKACVYHCKKWRGAPIQVIMGINEICPEEGPDGILPRDKDGRGTPPGPFGT